MDWVTVAALLIYAAFLIAQFVFVKSVEKGIQYRFDGKIENLRAELRSNEERFKSELRTKEAEISALRDGVLSGRANRQALLDKRRLEAAEKIWAAVIALAPAKAVSGTMSIIKYDEVAKEMSTDPNLREVMEGLLPPTDNYTKIFAKGEQPFVSQLAWAYYLAYIVIIRSGCFRADALRAGIEEPLKLLDHVRIKEVLKAALPDKSRLIETSPPAAFHDLLDALEEKLLAELKNMLEGRDLDEAAIVQAKHIVDASNKLASQDTEVAAAINKKRPQETLCK
jgi:hypothetical protein